MRGQSVTLARAAMVTALVAIAAAMTTVFTAAVAMAGPATEEAAAPPLESLYIVRSFFSDNLSDSYTEVIDVTPVGEDVRVRVFRISLANPFCPNKLLRAAETVIRRRSIKDVVSNDPCTLQPATVEKALNAANSERRYGLWHDASHTMVARCGGEERVFSFPYAIEIDEKKLRRSSRRVAELWDVVYHVPNRAFSDSPSMNDERPEVQRAFEALGDKLLPELTSGRFQTAFNSDSLLGYKGAPPLDERGLLPPALHEAAKYRFVKYVAPERSLLMLSARISGLVRLRVHVEPTTGQVTNVDVLRGAPLLAAEATRAARLWQFERGSVTGEPLDVYLNFSMDCRP